VNINTHRRFLRGADQADAFGWISIALHWITALIIIPLWFIGFGIGQQTGLVEMAARRDLHVGIAVLVWLLLMLRILWRILVRHPQAQGQSTRIHRVAMAYHYLMLTMLFLMLLSGPLLAWASGQPILIFGGLHFPVAAMPHQGLADMAHWVHQTAAMTLFWLIILHILAALKHLMFHQDDTFVRMLWPKRK
jgi:cytochrome b561